MGWFTHLQLSENAKDLISSCLTVDSDRRITLNEIKDHPWMKIDLLHNSRYLDLSFRAHHCLHHHLLLDLYDPIKQDDCTICDIFIFLKTQKFLNFFSPKKKKKKKKK